MEADPWSRLFSASRRHQSAVQSRLDLYLGLEEVDGGEDESRGELSCPFCSEDFDVVGLCCHIDDEHPVDAQNGICPFCEARVGMDMVGHLMMQHVNPFKMQRRRTFHKGSSGSHLAFPLLKKESRDGRLRSLLGGSSHAVSSSSVAPDPLLSSFICKSPVVDSSKDVEPKSLDEGSSVSKKLDDKVTERVEPLLSDKEQEEKARRSGFVRELMLSTIFDELSFRR